MPRESYRIPFLLAAALASSGACKRSPRGVAPAPLASTVESPSQEAPPPEPLPVASAIVPSSAAFADGGAPRGYERARVWDVVATEGGEAVLLLDASNTTVLPIFIGGTEALTIRLRLEGQRYARPLTHDLLSSIVRELGAVPVKAQIDDLRDDTFYGSLFVRQGERVLELDARPSDAIAVALGSGAPLYVSKSVLISSGVSRAQIETEAKEKELGGRKRGNPTSL